MTRLIGNILASAIAFLLLLSFAHTTMAATSIGSATDVRTLNSDPGDTVTFRALLFNIHVQNTVRINMYTSGPDGWAIGASPESFDLLYSFPGDRVKKNGYEYLGTSMGDIQARPVEVSVQIPYSADPGEYRISATAQVSREASAIGTLQSRSFDFLVVVNGATNQNDNSDDNKEDDSSTSSSGSQDSDPQDESGDTNVKDSENVDDTGLGLENDDATAQSNKESDDSTKQVTINQSNSLVGMMIGAGTAYGLPFIIIVIILMVSWKVYKHD